MRISASGLLSTIAVAIDQILRLAPSIRPPIEPVVSRTNATSTVGFANACDSPADRGRVARANASERSVMRDIKVLLRVFRPSEPKFPRLHGGVWPKSRRARVEFAAYSASHLRMAAVPESDKLLRWN